MREAIADEEDAEMRGAAPVWRAAGNWLRGLRVGAREWRGGGCDDERRDGGDRSGAAHCAFDAGRGHERTRGRTAHRRGGDAARRSSTLRRLPRAGARACARQSPRWNCFEARKRRESPMRFAPFSACSGASLSAPCPGRTAPACPGRNGRRSPGPHRSPAPHPRRGGP